MFVPLRLDFTAQWLGVPIAKWLKQIRSIYKLALSLFGWFRTNPSQQSYLGIVVLVICKQ